MIDADDMDALTLFPLVDIPAIVPVSPSLGDGRWCSGSGIPGDNCEFGHPVPAEFADVAWRETEPGRDTSRPRNRAMCHRCELTRRNYRDSLNEDESKARTWVSSKARKYAEAWGCTPAEARYRFELDGVTLDFMTGLFRLARERGTCPDWRHGGCGHEFAPGTHDLTGDIKDPELVAQRGHLLCDDIHIQCFTCNRSKGPKRWQVWLRLCAYFHHCEGYLPPGEQESLV